jgi:hypothetical protein
VIDASANLNQQACQKVPHVQGGADGKHRDV